MKKVLFILLAIQSALAMQKATQEEADLLLSKSLVYNNVTILKEAIAAGANVNAIPQEESPPLLAALFHRADISLIKMLLVNGANTEYYKDGQLAPGYFCYKMVNTGGQLFNRNSGSLMLPLSLLPSDEQVKAQELLPLAKKYLFLMYDYLKLKKQAENQPSTELLRELIIKSTEVDLSDLIFIILQSNKLYVTEKDIALAQQYPQDSTDQSIKRSLVNYKEHFDMFMKQFAKNSPYGYLPEEIINNIVSFLH
jgi:hypothetical protein